MAFNIYGNNRRHYSVSMTDIDDMSGLEFESFVGELLKSLGYSGVQITKSSGDQGADVIASKDGIKYAIQCKNYSSPLNNKPIQEVTTGKAVYGCDVGVVLTNSTFNQNAVEAANATGTLLWDRQILQEMLSQSVFAKPTSAIQMSEQMEFRAQQTSQTKSTPLTSKKRNIALFIIGIFLVGAVLSHSSSDDKNVTLVTFLFLLIFFLVTFFVLKNKIKYTSTKGSYRAFQSYTEKPISWVAVVLWLVFFCPVGVYLLCKKMSQNTDATELPKNSKILAIVFICLSAFFTIIALYTKSASVLSIDVIFIIISVVLLYRSKMLDNIIKNEPNYTQNVHTSPNIISSYLQPHKTVAEYAEYDVVQDDENFDEYYYDDDTIEPTYVIVHCKGCNAPNRIIKGSVAECEYCGAPVGEQNDAEPILDDKEAAIYTAFAVIQQLIDSIDEASDDFADSVDCLTIALETFPNRSMPLDIELNRVSSCLSNFADESKRVSTGIRAQVMIVCDNLMDYDDESWENIEEEIDVFTDIKNSLSETISSMRTFRHTTDTLNVNAGFRTYKIKAAQIQLVKVIDQSLVILQSSMADFTESIKTFRNAKFTSKTQRIKTQKQK